jgi:hypothetical protein
MAIRACRNTGTINQDTLLAILNDGSSTPEVQTVEILSKNGFPDGGTFTLAFSTLQATEPITYYPDNPQFTARLMVRALAPFAETFVKASSATFFQIEFTGKDTGFDFPQLQLASNNLTLGGVAAGEVRLNTISEGNMDASAFKLLRTTPRDQWQVVSFDPKASSVCVLIRSGKTTSTISIRIPDL